MKALHLCSLHLLRAHQLLGFPERELNVEDGRPINMHSQLIDEEIEGFGRCAWLGKTHQLP